MNKFTPKRTIFASAILSAMFVDHLQSIVNNNWKLLCNLNDLNSFNVFQDCNCIWFINIQLNNYMHGISHNRINKNNMYSKEFELQRIMQDNKWKNYAICDDFNLFVLFNNCKYIINFLSIFQHGFNNHLFILLNYCLLLLELQCFFAGCDYINKLIFNKSIIMDNIKL